MSVWHVTSIWLETCPCLATYVVHCLSDFVTCLSLLSVFLLFLSLFKYLATICGEIKMCAAVAWLLIITGWSESGKAIFRLALRYFRALSKYFSSKDGSALPRNTARTPILFGLFSFIHLKPVHTVAEKCDSRRISPLSRRFRRQSHFPATVWAGLYSESAYPTFLPLLTVW